MMLDHQNSYAFIDGTFTDCLLLFLLQYFRMLLLLNVVVRAYMHSACGGAFLQNSFVSAVIHDAHNTPAINAAA